MTSLSEQLRHDHARCDALFAEAESLAAAGNWRDCLERTEAFVAAVLQHFGIEEGVVFPAFEARTGMRGGPTRVMCGEHAQMRDVMAVLVDAAREADAMGYEDAAETLLILMQQHNLKEENILYPMCEQALGDALGPLENAVCQTSGARA